MQGRKIDRIPEFDRELKKLNKKHHGLAKEIDNILDELAADKRSDGNQLKGYDGQPLFKIRCGTGIIGKRNGVRVIYFKDDLGLGPLLIFAKNMKSDASRKEIDKRLTSYFRVRSSS